MLAPVPNPSNSRGLEQGLKLLTPGRFNNRGAYQRIVYLESLRLKYSPGRSEEDLKARLDGVDMTFVEVEHLAVAHIGIGIAQSRKYVFVDIVVECH